MALERLHKVMAEAGVASRRHAEEMIAAGRVTVNGEVVTEMGVRVDPERDRIEVDDKPLTPDAKVYLALNKPAGVITTAEDTHDRPTVLSLIPEDVGRVYPVGRLDMESQGLLLLTNDGDLAYRLTHPGFEHEKEYKIRVAGHPSEKLLTQLARGVVLEDGPTLPAQISVLQKKRDSTWLRVVLREGRKRQLRRMFDTIDHPVWDLIRMRVGPIQLGDLPPGEWRRLSAREVQALRRLAAGEAVDVVRAPSQAGRPAARAVGGAAAVAAAQGSQRSPRPGGRGPRPDEGSVPGGQGRRVNDAPPRSAGRAERSVRPDGRPGGGQSRRRDEGPPRPARPAYGRNPRPDDDDDWWMHDERPPRHPARGGSGRPPSAGGRPTSSGGGRPPSAGGRPTSSGGPSSGGGGRPPSAGGRSTSSGGRPSSAGGRSTGGGGSRPSGGGGGRPPSAGGRSTSSGGSRPSGGGSGRPSGGGGGRPSSAGGRSTSSGGSRPSGGGGGRPSSAGGRPTGGGGSRPSGGGGGRPSSAGGRSTSSGGSRPSGGGGGRPSSAGGRSTSSGRPSGGGGSRPPSAGGRSTGSGGSRPSGSGRPPGRGSSRPTSSGGRRRPASGRPPSQGGPKRGGPKR